MAAWLNGRLVALAASRDGTNLWLKAELMTTNLPPDATYSTAHHAESMTEGSAFELKVRFAD